MTTKFTPKNAVKAIHTHYDSLASACINSSGVMSFAEEPKTIEELTAQKLLSMIDVDHEYFINGKVRALVNYLEGHFLFRQRHREIEDNLDDLKEAVAKYNRVYHKGDVRAREKALTEIRDYQQYLYDLLEDIIISFYHLVDEDYSLVSDLDEKIHQMHRCSDELTKINEIFRRLTVGKFEEEFQSEDPTINRIIFKSISKKVSEGINEIAILSEKIVKRIDKLNQEKKLKARNHLIDMFAELYTDRPDFVPNVDSYYIPGNFSIAQRLDISFNPELTTSTENIPDFYRECAAQSLYSNPKVTDRKEPENSPEFKDARGGIFRHEKSELEQKIDYFMQAVISEKVTGSISARQGYTLLKIEELNISLVDWLYIVFIGFTELPPEKVENIIMEPVKVNLHPAYDGNQFYKDFIFKKRLNS